MSPLFGWLFNNEQNPNSIVNYKRPKNNNWKTSLMDGELSHWHSHHIFLYLINVQNNKQKRNMMCSNKLKPLITHPCLGTDTYIGTHPCLGTDTYIGTHPFLGTDTYIGTYTYIGTHPCLGTETYRMKRD